MMRSAVILFLTLFSTALAAQKPQLKGGLPNFLRENMVYPNYSLHNCIEGAVQLSFKVNQKGEVYEAKVTQGILGDLDKEALRLIRRSSGKWEVPTGHDSTAVLVMPVKFILEGYGCERKSKNEIELAKRAYQNKEELTQVILNFYQNKEKGITSTADEPKILQLKNELEIDDEYLESRINDGLKKYKQGDKQGACEDFIFVKYMGSDKANDLLLKYCK